MRLFQIMGYEYIVGQTFSRFSSIIFSTSTASIESRIIAAHAKNLGIKVVGLTHGNDTAIFPASISLYNDYSLYDEFVFRSQSVACIQSEQYHLQPISKFNTVNFISCNHSTIKPSKKIPITPLPSKTKTVMLIGTAMTPIRYINRSCSFFYYSLKLEITLLKTLSRNGFKTIYKPHPYCVSSSVSIFSKFADDIITLPFEDATYLADALLFHRTDTTTFGYALLTDKPITLLSLDSYNTTNTALGLTSC